MKTVRIRVYKTEVVKSALTPKKARYMWVAKAEGDQKHLNFWHLLFAFEYWYKGVSFKYSESREASEHIRMVEKTWRRGQDILAPV